MHADAQRAEEMQAVEPKVAYYCRLWAVDQVRHADEARARLRADKGARPAAGGAPHVLAFHLDGLMPAP
jgi:hypothetical protein